MRSWRTRRAPHATAGVWPTTMPTRPVRATSWRRRPRAGAFTAATGDLAFRTYVQVQGIERVTTAGCSTWTVPNGVTSVRAWAVGARGEAAGTGVSQAGRGDGIAATIGNLRGGDPLRVCVASGGGQASGAHDGGGASGVARGPDFAVPALIAGGGGSAGAEGMTFGGDAGLPSGGAGNDTGSAGGKGGTQTAGGAGGEWLGNVAEAGTATDATGPGRGGGAARLDRPGGGGGGYFGGGAGWLTISGGGGGSSFCADVAPVSECTHYGVQGTLHEPGIGFGAPQVTLLYTVLDAPRVEVAAPAPGAEYALGQAVATSFSCIEAPNGPGIAGCTDQAGRVSGAALDTSTPGAKTLAVTAVSIAGLRFTREVAYTVRAPAASPPPPLASKIPLRLTGLSQSSARWYRSGRSRRGHTVGTTLRFTLNRRATVTFSFVRRTPGRRSRRPLRPRVATPDPGTTLHAQPRRRNAATRRWEWTDDAALHGPALERQPTVSGSLHGHGPRTRRRRGEQLRAADLPHPRLIARYAPGVGRSDHEIAEPRPRVLLPGTARMIDVWHELSRCTARVTAGFEIRPSRGRSRCAPRVWFPRPRLIGRRTSSGRRGR